MELHFNDNEQGLYQLWVLKHLIKLVEKHDGIDAHLLSQLGVQIDEHLTNENHANVIKSFEPIDFSSEAIKGQSFKDILRQFFGPGKKEIELSKQRQRLIARAEHAEASAFEALAETAEIGRQRDEALAHIKDLEKALKSLQQGSD